MPTVFVEDSKEFAERHGNDPVHLKDEQRLLFSDGAMMDDTVGNQRREPPEDKLTLLSLKKKYFHAKLREAEQQFRRTREGYSQQCAHAYQYRGSLPYPDEDQAVAHLQQLRDVANGYRQQLEEIHAQIEQLPETIERRKREAAREKERSKIAMTHSKINAMSLAGEEPTDSANNMRHRMVVENQRLANQVIGSALGIRTKESEE